MSPAREPVELPVVSRSDSAGRVLGRRSARGRASGPPDRRARRRDAGRGRRRPRRPRADSRPQHRWGDPREPCQPRPPALDRTPDRRGACRAGPRQAPRSPSRSWGRPGVRRMPTGWPTRSSSIRPCSAGSIRPWARSTNRTPPRSNAAPGSSTSKECGPVTPVQPSPARPQRRRAIEHAVEHGAHHRGGAGGGAGLRAGRHCRHCCRRARRPHRRFRSCLRAGPRPTDRRRPGGGERGRSWSGTA